MVTYGGHVPSPQPSLGPLTGVWVRRYSSSVIDGSTPAASYRLPFTASTTAACFPISLSSPTFLTTRSSWLGLAPHHSTSLISPSRTNCTEREPDQPEASHALTDDTAAPRHACPRAYSIIYTERWVLQPLGPGVRGEH
jgi:hypothetical protein